MIISMLQSEWVLDPGEWAKIQTQFRAPLYTPPDMFPKTPVVKPEVNLIKPVMTVIVFDALAALSWALLVGAVVELLIVGQMQFQTPRQRRRVRTQICTKTCLTIIASARQTAFSKYARNRALETSELERRTARRFLSRA